MIQLRVLRTIVIDHRLRLPGELVELAPDVAAAWLEARPDALVPQPAGLRLPAQPDPLAADVLAPGPDAPVGDVLLEPRPARRKK
jgi:hypothetical protein